MKLNLLGFKKLSSSSNVPTKKISDEAIIIKQYKPLIDKLIPLHHENRLLEGLNKFSDKLPSRVRNIIKEEVIRLTSLTDASADNSEFAKFPIMKFKHFGIPMQLDKVGKEVLMRETKRFLDRYTVGVFESVMNSDHYQSMVKQQQQEKIAKAFSVESQYFNDIDFGQDLAIRPNYTVSCTTFDKGKSCPLASLSFHGMTVETKRAPVLESDGSLFVFTFPKIAGFTDKVCDITFILKGSQFNKEMSVFESSFRFAPGTPKKLIDRLTQYIKSSVNQFPLQRDLEIERAMQNLERDRALAYSPWIPLFLGYKDGVLCPLFELKTTVNSAYNSAFSALKDLPSNLIFHHLIKELNENKETFLLTGVIENKKQQVPVAATHRQLANSGLIKQFIERATQSDKFSVIQFRMETVEARHKNVAFDIHDIIASEYPDLESISHILFCKDVTSWIGNLEISHPEPLKRFPKAIIDDLSRWPINVVMEDTADRRSEARYLINTPAKIKVSFLRKHDAMVEDLSARGMKLTVTHPSEVKLDKQVKVSISSLNLKNQKYQIIKFNPDSGVLHLCLPQQEVKSEGQKLRNLFHKHTEYFTQRDLSIRQRNIYRFLWELSVRNLPCASVLITNNRFTIDRLKTVYHRIDSFDLQPFSVIGNEVPLHGFLADKEATGPKSKLLDEMLKGKMLDTHVVHVLRTKDSQIIFVKEQDFWFGNVRNQISDHVAKGAIKACVTHLSMIKCNQPTTSITSKRLAQISKIDIDVHTKLTAMQKGYTHVLYITNVSVFHNVLLQFGIYPKNKEQADNQ
jgi:hypothetical protein